MYQFFWQYGLISVTVTSWETNLENVFWGSNYENIFFERVVSKMSFLREQSDKYLIWLLIGMAADWDEWRFEQLR